MNDEEKKAIEELSKKAVFCNYEERDYPNMICFKKDMLIVLNLIEKLQKENEELKERIREHTLLISPYYVKENFIPIQRIENLIKELKQDDINMTRKYKEKNNITGELLGIDKVRVRAYREKTREIKEKLQKLLSD